ncbi:HAD family phosphatase [Brachybacterium sp. EF45031]|uniref:HAD family hydrolase n=1 Tax=Brachybacterium sillae TaxID=2810536 RepID=UPI00217E6942|nr:HAD family phosphatase [Brachybacterium sillae]MCS6712199.1 HAD family phosphatase [Brachybacterium sillae]
MTAPDRRPHPDNPLRRAFGDWTPSAVVVDCDGLLMDTESVWNGTQRTILERYGTTLSPEDDAAIVGTTVEDAAAIIARASGRDLDQVLPELKSRFEEDLRADLDLLPGAEQTVRAIAAKVPIGCASNSWHEALVDKLTRTGLIDAFSTLQSADTVENPKPAGDMYAAAVAALGATPEQALGVEDSALGGRAVLAAGLRLLAVPPVDGDVPGAHVRLSSLDDPALHEWIRSW